MMIEMGRGRVKVIGDSEKPVTVEEDDEKLNIIVGRGGIVIDVRKIVNAIDMLMSMEMPYSVIISEDRIDMYMDYNTYIKYLAASPSSDSSDDSDIEKIIDMIVRGEHVYKERYTVSFLKIQAYSAVTVNNNAIPIVAPMAVTIDGARWGSGSGELAVELPVDSVKLVAPKRIPDDKMITITVVPPPLQIPAKIIEKAFEITEEKLSKLIESIIAAFTLLV